VQIFDSYLQKEARPDRGGIDVFVNPVELAVPDVIDQGVPQRSWLYAPFVSGKKILKLTFLGSAKQMKSIIEFFRKTGIRFSLRLLADAKFSGNTPLSHLTDKQRRVVTSAL